MSVQNEPLEVNYSNLYTHSQTSHKLDIHLSYTTNST